MTNHYLAQIRNPVLPNSIGGGTNPSVEAGGGALGSIISNLVGALFIAGFLLAFFYLLQGAIKWISAGGDKTKLEAARDTITSAIVGIVIAGAAYAITTVVANFFGLDLKTLPIPSIPAS